MKLFKRKNTSTVGHSEAVCPVKDVELKKLTINETEIQIRVQLNLEKSKRVEVVQIQLIERDSKEVRNFSAKSIRKLNRFTFQVDFRITLLDFTELAQFNYWVEQGIVDSKICVAFKNIPLTKYDIKSDTSETKKDMIDFTQEMTEGKSFIITPYFRKNDNLTFQTARVETEIFKKYVAKPGLHFLVMEKETQRRASYYASNYDHTELDPNVILYETRNGRSITCSPYAIFKYLISHDQYRHFKHYWVVKEELLEDIKADVPSELLENMTLVVKNSKEYIDLLLTAKYLVANGSCFKPPFRKKEGQISINTWHGVPIKHMCFDTPGISRFRNIVRQFMQLDYFISPNPHTTKVMVHAYKMKSLFQGEILEYGYPRMDVTVSSQTTKTKAELLGQNVKLDSSKPTLIYMPTWRGGSTKEAVDSVNGLAEEVLALKEKVATHYNVLVKVHPFLYEHVKDDARLSDVLVSDLRDPNEVLTAVDVMIADYSSVFFDFIPTKKPIIYYMKDREEYETTRGLYINPDDLPGAVAYHLEELASVLTELAATDLRDDSSRRQAFTETYSPLDDGCATKRVVEHIFDYKSSTVGKVMTLESEKKKVLIKPGSLAPGELTERYVALTHQIDYDKYDVTHLCKLAESGKSNLKRIHPTVRQMFVSGTKLYSMEERLMENYYKHHKKENDRDERLIKAYQREESRLVPIGAFDYIVDLKKNSGNDFEEMLQELN